MNKPTLSWLKPFWEQPFWRWEAMFEGDARAAYVASAFAARLMVEQKSGLIVNISFWAAQKYMAYVSYGAVKTAMDKMTADMAHEAKEFNRAVVSLYPGLVHTESVLRAAQYFDISNSESPQFTVRVIAAWANDPNIMSKTGKLWVGTALAESFASRRLTGSSLGRSRLKRLEIMRLSQMNGGSHFFAGLLK